MLICILFRVIKVYGVCIDDPPFLIVTEFLENGDLRNFLKRGDAKERLNFDKLVRISENVS